MFDIGNGERVRKDRAKRNAADMKSTKKQTRLNPDIGEWDHIDGPVDAPLTLVEYGDFECPYSSEAMDTVRAIQQSFGGQLRFVFRHFPLDKHPHAFSAAEIAEAAGAQGKFWDMYEWLFEHQTDLAKSRLLAGARTLGVDLERLERDLSNKVYVSRVEADKRGGITSGVSGTPTFFINGVRHQGEGERDDLMAALREAES